ncbi:MAG: Mismatch repair protein msh3 [Candelina mexicana]|nr:MAG: Mismatch repair protein msh3 [Candelina mexicana]
MPGTRGGPPSTKKQQSISNFFTAKSFPTSSLPTSPNCHHGALDSTPSGNPKATTHNNGIGNDGALFVSPDGDTDLLDSGRRNYFATKRSPDNDGVGPGDDVDGEGTVLPVRKRQRMSEDGAHFEEECVNGKESIERNGNLGRKQATNAHAAGSDSGGTKRAQLSERTSKYLFSSSPATGGDDVETDDAAKQERERIHMRFVKKLGRPDSIAEIKRRNWHITEETAEIEAAAEEGEEGEEEAEHVNPAPKGRKGVASKKGASKLTPMEKQMLEIKRKHMDTLLVVEVGYKFRFFGEDARIAAKELGIVCIPGKFRYDEHSSEAHMDRFASASIPVHRLHVHVKRLVAAGQKVGIVRQLETAALKAAGDNRNTPFVRKLTNLYTKGTYVDDVEGLEGPANSPSGGAPATGYLLCITENNSKGWGTDEKVHVGIVAVQPATGDVLYDDFEDGFMRSEIETRMLHIAPCELLIVGQLSKATEKLVQYLAGSSTNVFGDKVRVERTEKSKTIAAESYSHVSTFYASKMHASSHAQDEAASNLLEKVLKLPEHVTICLSSMIIHMAEYGLEHVFDLTKYFQSFSARSHMLLNGTTLTSLEIYQNQTDHSEKGSLFWSLDRTQTRFGQRLLRKWVGRPMLDKARLEERVAAVEELKEAERIVSVDKLKSLLSKTKSDLEKSLIRIYYGKCTRPELLTVLQTMQRIANEFALVKSPAEAGFKSEIINQAISSLPTISDDVNNFLEKINAQAARDDDRYTFFRDDQETEDITDNKLGIAGVEHELNEHRAIAAGKIRKKKVDYVTVAGIEYLIEVENTQASKVPASWAKISGTKRVSRFHTPDVVRLIRMRDQHKEALAAACDTAFAALQADIAGKYQVFRDCIQSLATLDCLLSLATVASQPGYVKPEYTEETCIFVREGRHPMVEQLLLDAYVPNDIDLSADGARGLLITGPNMGGKSSYVRQVALIAIMGQIGSYVPAASAKLGMLDAVFTRMGAFDNMMAGESTFMVELSETSDILKQATPRSLVILDELGRGTSTHDGVAIAQAVLDYVIRQNKSLTLFITHYQNLSTLAKAFEGGELKNVHMKFTEEGKSGEEITFLYEIGEGVAHRSYGLNVARLAHVPEVVLEVASTKSKELEAEASSRHLDYISRSLHGLLQCGDDDYLEQLITGIEQL